MLRTLLLAMALLAGLSGCDSADSPAATTLTYTAERSGDGPLTDVTVRYTGADGQPVEVAVPTLPFSRTVTTIRRGVAEIEVVGTYPGSSALLPVTVSATVHAVRAGTDDLTDTRFETVASNTSQPVRVTARVTVP